MSANISDIITKRLIDNNVRYYAGDNISAYINDVEIGELIDEVTEKFEEVLRSLIIDVDNDPNSQGTARRLAKMYIWETMSGRYDQPPRVAAFPNVGEDKYEGMLVVRSELKSLCSHHHQPVTGLAYIGVIPREKVIGLSKYTRIAQHCAMRGTLQEELCRDILESIKKATESEDVAVYIQATHGCCENRGIRAHSSLTQTTLLSGQFHTADVKKEFFDNIALQQQMNK